MYLATEYFIRSGIAKRMLQIPCSLFMTENGEKKVVTITNCCGLTDRYVVKHWLVGKCRSIEVMPAIREFVVSCLDDPYVILKGHRLLEYHEEAVPSYLNSDHHPMTADLYNRHSDEFFCTASHRQNRENWLWDDFARIYFPHLLRLCGAIFTYRNVQEAANDQRGIVMKHYPDRWLYWLKWRKYMLDCNRGIPAELVFALDYKN